MLALPQGTSRNLCSSLKSTGLAITAVCCPWGVQVLCTKHSESSLVVDCYLPTVFHCVYILFHSTFLSRHFSNYPAILKRLCLYEGSHSIGVLEKTLYRAS